MSRVDVMFELARNLSFKSTEKHQHGAVLAKGCRVLNTGFNRSTYSKLADRHKGSRRWHGTQHAEIDAINCRNASGGVVYVVRTNSAGDLVYSKPCLMCQASMRAVGIRSCYYSIGNKEWGKMSF